MARMIIRERKHPQQQNIKFSTLAPGIPEPELASHFIPKWFSDMPSHVSGVSGEGTGPTAKRCVPLLDAMMSGYIIPLWMDLKVAYTEGEDGKVRFEWTNTLYTSQGTPLNRASIVLQNGAPDPKVFFDMDELNINGNVWKLNSPWIITTPPGYSCLFTMPFNHPMTNLHFLSAIVDTDTYTNTTNLPFVWTSNSWEGLISAGTPLIQVIPFRRDSFKMEIDHLQDNKLALESHNAIKPVYDNGYRKKFWVRKLWK